MGMLDQFFGSPEQTQALGLLGLGLMRGDFGAGAGNAMQHLAQAKERERQAKMDEVRGLLAQAQLDTYREDTAQKRADRERQAALNAKLPGFIRQPGTTGGEPVPQTLGDIPMFSQPMGVTPMRQTHGGFDMPGALLAGMSPATAKAYAEAMSYGKPKVARTVEVMRNGKPTLIQLDESGQEVGQGYDQWKAPQFQSLGNRVGVLDPVTGQERSSLPMGVDPGTIYSGGISMRGQNMTDARAREQQAQEAAQGRTQYDPQRGGLVNMQTGEFKPAMQNGQPVETKASREAAKEALMQKGAIAGADSVLKEVRDAKGLVGWNTAGVGGVTQLVPATEGRNLSAKLQTIKANLGFDRLQQMRQESPTGGALGQIAVQELAALQATVASLDQLQSPTQLGQALDKIESHYTNWRNVMEQARSGQGGATGGWGIREKK